MRRAGLPRAAGLAGALALALAPVMVEAAAPGVTCPDPATVQAARLVEFQTMMMGVAVRCRHVGVPIGEHLEGMTSARRTMLGAASDRVATYLRSLGSKPAPATSAATAPAMAASTPPTATAPPTAKSPPVSLAATRKADAQTAPGKRKLASTVPPPAKAAPAPVGYAPVASATPKARKAAAAAPPQQPTRPAAKVSRRTDPYDRYLTMIGNQYGGGITTLQRCKAFDAIVLSLADKANTDRLLTMVSSSLVQATLLEAIVNCPAGRK